MTIPTTALIDQHLIVLEMNDWLIHSEIRVHFICEKNGVFMFSFEPNTKWREIGKEDIVTFDRDSFTINCSDGQKFDSFLAPGRAVFPEWNNESLLVNYIIGEILNSKK